MEDYSVIQGQTVLGCMFAFLLTAVSSYLCIRWLANPRKVDGVNSEQVPTEISTLNRLRMNVRRHSCLFLQSPSRCPQGKFFLVGEWLAPMIVWLVVALTGLAVVSLLVAQ